MSLPHLAGKRIAVVASGGSGATAALCGVRRAFEEAGIEPVFLSACSGATLFGSLWAAGLSADEMASFWLGLETRDYIDPDYRALGRALFHGFRGYCGVLRGDAIEATYRRRLGSRMLGETSIPFSAVVWNIDRNRIEYLSTRTTPAFELARAARIAISIPVMVEPVKIGSEWYGDGGIVDIFPTAPLEAEAPLDFVLGINSYLPPQFTGEDIGNWHERTFSIFRASGQVRYASYLELAREHVRSLGKKLTLIQPVAYAEVRGAKFYENFFDRSNWPRFMLQGHSEARRALAEMEMSLCGVAATPPRA
jgi:NTE family protein